jgi:hypothetical protein
MWSLIQRSIWSKVMVSVAFGATPPSTALILKAFPHPPGELKA